jgi:hypothetical protein
MFTADIRHRLCRLQEATFLFEKKTTPSIVLSMSVDFNPVKKISNVLRVLIDQLTGKYRVIAAHREEIAVWHVVTSSAVAENLANTETM